MSTLHMILQMNCSVLEKKTNMNFTSSIFLRKKNGQSRRFYFGNTTPYFKTDQSMQYCCWTDEEYFRVGIFIPFLDNFIVTLEARFTAHKSIIDEFQCLIFSDPTSGPTPQQIKSIQVLGKFYENDLTKFSGELVPELILWYRKLFRLNAAERQCVEQHQGMHFRCFSAHIFTLMTILLTLPVTTCNSEQLFSTLRRRKTCLRNTSGTTRMNGLALLNIYRSHTRALPWWRN